ncbi:right-handed parallel beta-helix repeat-containing protein [Belliella sp. DSM 111904]|uniref:Right-handed parallel beta-helix repeat-containing protein n=1 Tax=Belliella filtrata TaxID=2923435 RepID=A0ABS9UVC4_9BACT|nr:right-handed parallel beta-helix repeat-containing protein [Belliella filtrata]MCH7408117.1 right-handed parallel beta-helix repeat-containing protein [Belliella filtrata]
MNCSIFKKGLLLFLTSFICLSSPAADLWVALDGNDQQEGTKDSPLLSLQMALRKARELRRLNDPSVEGGIYIYVKGGTYFLDETLQVRPEDSGTASSPTIIMAAPGSKPVLSGGVKVTGWKKHSSKISGLPKAAQNNLWVAPIPRKSGRQVEFRQLYVNDKKANRASNLDAPELERILAKDNEKQEMWIPTLKVKLGNIHDAELVIHQWWAIANLRIKSMEAIGDSTKVTFHQPESLIEFEHPWPAPFIDDKKEYEGNSVFFIQGAVEFLDKPGEWYVDQKEGMLYYWPQEGEDMSSINAVVPVLETIVQVEGTLDSPVRHVGFQGLSFEHAGWMRPSKAGHVPLQAGWYILEAYALQEPGTPDKAKLENQAWIGRQAASIQVSNAINFSFQDCKVSHVAATGIDLITGVQHSIIKGNVFKDIGGTGIQAGFFGSHAFEAHLPYNPQDARELVGFAEISNNLISDATNEDWGCVGISVGFAHDINIEHNEIRDVNYSGICVGWGWTKTISASKNNRVHANKIHHFAKQMYDVGGIYTLSSQPNMEISENYIFDLVEAPYPHMRHHHQYIYFDEGSSYIRAINNWTEQDKFFSNTPGPGNEWENNGPQVSDEIKEKAGIQPAYQKIFDK